MPHVVYLHSALQRNRVRADSSADRQMLLRYNKWDCVVGLGLAGLVNLAMLCIAAGLFHSAGMNDVSDLTEVHAQLGAMVGGGAALAFAVALMASGLSSASVGAHAGQIVMVGFMNWQMPLIARRAITMAPALLILAIGVNPTQALVISQIVLSFGIPFALVPLLLLTRRRSIMGDMVNQRGTTVAMTAITVIITGLNLYLLYEVGAGFFD